MRRATGSQAGLTILCVMLAGLGGLSAHASPARCKLITGTETADALIASIKADYRCALPWHPLRVAVGNPAVLARIDAAYVDAKTKKPDKAEHIDELRDLAQTAAGRPEFSMARYDSMLAKKPDDAYALNTACWIRAIAGRELPTALKYCNAAIAGMGSLPLKQPGFFANRAKVELLLGDYQASVRDYNEAILGWPTTSRSFVEAVYARGIARLRANDRGGDADIKVAVGLYPRVGDELADMGFKP